jgi:hypothetical protein
MKECKGCKGSLLRANINLLLLLLNRLPPDITGGQGLNGFQKLYFLQYYKKFNRREMVPQW